MKEFEIKVSASYTTDGGSKKWNAFKRYITAKNATEAKRELKTQLKNEGYKNITLEAIEVK